MNENAFKNQFIYLKKVNRVLIWVFPAERVFQKGH